MHLMLFIIFTAACTFSRMVRPATSKHIKAFLVYQNLQVIDWPGNSSDLNTIENWSNHIKNLLKNKDISLVPKLKAAIKEL